MKIKMLKTVKGAEDRVTVKQYIQGEAYSITDALAKIFVENKLAEVIQEEPKQEDNALENMSKSQAPETTEKVCKKNKKDKDAA